MRECTDEGKCLETRRAVIAANNLTKDICSSCKTGIERERKAASEREALCGRCDAPLTNTEESFCSYQKFRRNEKSCLAKEIVERPDLFLEYLAVQTLTRQRGKRGDLCPRGHKLTGENVWWDGPDRRCKLCNKVSRIIRQQEARGKFVACRMA